MCVCNSGVCSVRCESAGRDRERSEAAGSKRPGESLFIDQLTQVSTDGRSGGTEPPHHYIRLHTSLFITLHVSIFSSLSGHMDTYRLFIFIIFHSGKKNKVRVYYLAWLRNKILHNDPEVEKKQGWTTVGEMEGCVHYKVGKCACTDCLIMHRVKATGKFALPLARKM